MKTIIEQFLLSNLHIVRKNVFKSVLSLLLILVSGSLIAQDQKTLLKQWGEGPIQEYTVNGKKGSYTYGGVSKDKTDLKLLKMDDPYLWGAKIEGIPGMFNNEYHADNNAHAVAMRHALVPHPSLTYHMRYDDRNEHRLVIVGDYMYMLEGWKSKDDYKIKKIFKKGRLKGMKLMKESFASIKKMAAVGHEKKLQAYLDKEYAIQKQKTPAWNKKNGKYLQALKDEALDWKNQVDDSYVKRNKDLAKRLAEKRRREGGGSSSSKSSSGKTVKVKISNKGSHGNLRVYWKEGGNWKSSGYSKGYSGYVSVPAGAQLFYSENGSAKKAFMSAPKSGSGSYNF